MSLKITTAAREIRFGTGDEPEVLADLNPTGSVESVVEMHAVTRPELATANIEGPVIEDGKAIYTVNTRLGKKG